MAFEAFIAWLPQGVAERMNRSLQNTMRKLLRGMRLPNHQWHEAMDHAVMLHNSLSSSSLQNNASPHLLWTRKQGNTKTLRVFDCMVQYRPPSARAGRFSQRAQWGLHLGIEKKYNAWKIFDVHSKETVAARDVLLYKRLTLPTYLANLEENRDPTGGFHGDRHFASAADEADWDKQNVDNASDEAGPLPYCSVPIPMDDENPRESVNAETYFDLADTGYVTPAEVNTNEAERIGPNFIPDPEAGYEAAYPADTTLPRYTQSGLQILGLVTAVHGTDTPKEPATVQQALGGEHKEKWREAMDKELKALQERNTWKVVPIGVARNKTILIGKWVFRVKTKADGTIDKFKAHWVVHGVDQEHGRDFTETFAPVSRHTSLRILLAIAAMKKRKLRQIDVAKAFLYAPVDAEIFVELPHCSHGEPNQWYAGRQRGGSAGPCTYVLRTGDRAGEQCGGLHSTHRCFGRLTDAWRHQFPDATEIPRWGDLSRAGVAIFDLDYDAFLAAMYALSTSDEGDCYLCVPPDPGIEAAALGAGEAAAQGASASAAPGAGESALSGTASAQVLHTFTLDSGASRSFFRDRTTLTPLSRPVAVSLVDPYGGPVLVSFSTVLLCLAAPSGSLSGLYLPSFSTNFVSGADLQDQGVDQFTPASQRVTHCTCARTGRHLATFSHRPGSSLYTLSTESPPVSASGQVAASSQVFAVASGSSPESAPCSCRLLSNQTLLWHLRLGHPSLPCLRGMASRVLVSGLPRSLPPLPPGPAPTCVPCVEGR
ncbi:unnamed protein product [Closterium sp. NIES-53]